MSEVTDMLRDLRDGKVTLAEVAANFSTREWVADGRAPAATLEELLWRDMTDGPGEIPKGSWWEVSVAKSNGVITDRQYAALLMATGS